jgi:hypothetical protein
MADRCDNCISGRLDKFKGGASGEYDALCCHRRAPLPSSEGGKAVWPNVAPDQWCREHEPAPTV